MYEAKIVRVINGVIIKVGCNNFVFNDINEGMEQLGKYYINPAAAMRDWKVRLTAFSEHQAVMADGPDVPQPTQPEDLAPPETQAATPGRGR